MSNRFSPFRLLVPQHYSDASSSDGNGNGSGATVVSAQGTAYFEAQSDLSKPLERLSISLPSSFKNPEEYVRFLDECAGKGRVDLIKQLSRTNRYDGVLSRHVGRPLAMPPGLSTFRE